ncbi:malectin domain-containing carbohydrate-binding protein [Flavisolibacter tropicus]|uniref:malectin domain-containing carbohydrate-binding protein n=1 Tax=Flavisolibacter tropicus TaxID=1492898 RepID=UPI0008342096|nr:malectin domain-containing carbohydrate-binding protein [Flavisolibacter tropicus]
MNSSRIYYPGICIYALLVALLSIALTFQANAQVNFTSSGLSGASLTNPTSLQFGPDGRLYVSQQNGLIKAFTVVRNGANSYAVTATETISLINQIPNHNDDGTVNTSVTTRQVTGILVTGTASQPKIYVTSSDSRIGGGTSGSDVNLDTNSGIISLLTWNGSSWTKIDLVRGLPRSEENHSPNGIQIDPSGNKLYVSMGGITNAGAPSNNFGFTCEYALSAAIISVDLTAINALPTQGSGNTAFKYDIPTLDDPTRSNVSGKDVNDPFGGNDGLNQAKIVAGGPVEIFSPGYRNPYDLLITKTVGKAGRIYTIDNGANPGWGGYPEGEGTANVTNNYNSNEPGSTTGTATEDKVNNLDGLHYIGTLGTYVPGSYYGGHPNPTRANPNGAGLYTRSGTTGVFRTQTSGSNPLPVDWPPVATANSIEGDFQQPGTSASTALLTFSNSTNGITEYTASNFNNALKGAILAASYDGAIYKIGLTTDGKNVTNSKSSTNKLNQDAPFASGFGSTPLDITAQGDNDIFPGTVWAATYGSNAVTVFEPTDMATCTGLDNNQDDDLDGYTNADEIDNNTNPCSASSKPADFDNDKVSDLNDPDDDNDGINDNVDLFPIDANNGGTTSMPINYELLNNSPGTGFFGLGFTGLMSNKQTGNNYLNTYNPDNLVAGGAIGAFTIVDVSPKDALGTLNNQENGFQFGVKAGNAPFTISSKMLGPFFNNKTPSGNQSQGIFIGTGDQSNYLKITLNANGGVGGIQVVVENNDVPVSSQFSISGGIPNSSLEFFLSVNPTTGVIQPKYSSNDGALINAGSPIQVSGALLSALQSGGVIAVGIISTSINGPTFTATWDNIKVTADAVNTSWTTVASSGVGKWVGVSVVVNNKMYVFSGFDNPQVHITPKCEIYDPATNTWTYAADMPFPVTHAGITVDGSKVYVSGGFLLGSDGGPNTDKLQIYDANTNTWSFGPSLPELCGGNALVRVGRKLHSFGGVMTDRQTGNPAHYVLDLDNINQGWVRKADMPLSRCHFASAFVGGKIYALGGQTGHDGTIADVKYVQVYDPSTDTWTRLKDMPYSRSHSESATFVIDGKVYLVGGRANTTFSNVLPNVTFYDPATDSWTEDTPLPVNLFGPAAEAIGSELIVSNGSFNQCCDPQTTTRKRGITRTPNFKIGFVPGTLNMSVGAGGSTTKEVILWTLSGTPTYTINTSGFPSWLSVTPTSGTIDLLGGTEINVTANAASLAVGSYSATVIAKATGYPDAVLNVSLTVTSSNKNVLYVYGSIPPAQDDMKMSYTGATGMSQFKQALIDVGFNPTEALDANITLNAATLNQYKILILGSNNRRFTAAESAAVATWVNAGGGLVAWSDAAFGWSNGQLNSSEGSLSDNDITQQFGLQFLHDNGQQSFTYNQWAIDHYINKFNKNAGVTIKAEGVSPIRTSGSATIVGGLPAGMSLNSMDGPVTAADAALAVAKIGQGRVAGFFDRNAFWNGGAGTNINEVDNKVFAQRLFLWVSGVDNDPTTPPPSNVVYRINSGGPEITTSIGTFAADNFFSPTPGFVYTTTSAIAGTNDDALYQNERGSDQKLGTFSYAFPVSNGTYTVVLHFVEMYQTVVGARVFDVSMENVKVLDNYDIFKKVGKNVATTETFTVTVNDGTLNMLFSALAADGGVNRPEVTGIEILTSGATTNQPPTANAGNDQTITLPSNSVTLNGSGNDPGGAITAYSWQKLSGPAQGTIASPGSASTNVTGLVQGTYVFRLTVTDNGNPAATGFDDVTITVNGTPTTNVVYRINSGGPEITTSIGTFAADNFFSPTPGFVYTTTSAIAGTNDDALYQNERGSDQKLGTFSYAFPVSNGTYTVVLHFVEMYQTVVGARVFDVSMENVKVLDNYDIFKKVGKNVATTETFTVTVNDGTLNMLFSALAADGGVNRPEVTGIEILTSGATTNQPPTANAGNDQTITLPSNSVTLNGSGNDPGGAITAYSWQKLSGPAQGTIASPGSASTNVTGLVQGTYVFRLTVTDNGNPAATGFDDVTITVNGTPTTVTNYKINTGGPDLTTSFGSFTADNFFSPSPGFTFSTTQPINGTADDALYQTERSATAGNGTFSYAFPINNGTYTVILHFAEIYQTAINRRLFDVSIENVKVLDNYDIFKKVGGFTATTETFTTTVADGVLDIYFSALAADGGVDRPKVSAVEISPVSTPPVASLSNEALRTDNTQSSTIIAYPNPSFDGRYKVVLPKALEGELTYSLVSSTGSELAKGKQNLLKATSVLDFNFSQQTQREGVYYLKINSKSGQLNLKLARINK